uniref:ATP-dependent DNA helicase 2 subunit KU70 n=1 Tax=Juniperus oxycedrus TaxID=69008 RepID=A0A3Q8C5K9_JUNOX|nr:putative KU70-like protein [Juniperus oxycedrus]
MDLQSDDLFPDEDDEENSIYSQDKEAGKEFVVYMIDAGPDMFLQIKEEDDVKKPSHFSTVVKCILESLKTRIINSDYDEVAICFFNTREKRNLQESEGVYVFNVREGEDLDRPTARLIKDFSHIEDTFEKEIGSQSGIVPGSRENPLYSALWVAQGLLRKGSTRNVDKHILLFTNNDDPFGNADPRVKADMSRTTIQRAKDSRDLGISIELFPLSRPGEEFNVSIFFADMLELENDESSEFMPMVAEKFEDLTNQLKKRMYKKRVVRKITLMVADGLSIGLHTYALIRPAQTGKITWLDSVTNKPLKLERSYICADTGALVTETLARFQTYQNEKVKFSIDELSEIRKVTSVPLRLLGFKPLHCLKDYHNLRPATFLYPSDEEISGSICAFIALYRAMLRFQKYGVAFYGNTQSPQLVALLPQEEVTNSSGQIDPPGLHMIYLPYSDDIRHIEKLHMSTDGPVPRASKEQIDKATAMIKKLELREFSVYQISNPALQRHYAILQALALDENEDLPETKDETMPDEESMQRPGITNAVQEFKDVVYGSDYCFEVNTKTKGDETSKKRKALTEVAEKEAGNYDWRELAETQKLKNLTVVELKYYLTAHNLPLTGKKEVLINRILTHLGL